MVAFAIIVLLVCIVAAIGIGSVIHDHLVAPRITDRVGGQTWPEYRQNTLGRTPRPGPPPRPTRGGDRLHPQDREFRYNTRHRSAIPDNRIISRKPGRPDRDRRSHSRQTSHPQRKRVKRRG